MEHSPAIEAIKKRVRQIATGLELSKFSIEMIPLSSLGFASETFKIALKGSLNASEYERNFFVKRTCDEESFRKVFAPNSRFQCEVYAYEEVIPTFCSIQNEIISTDFERLSFPEYYGGSGVENEEFVILECLNDYKTQSLALLKPFEAEVKSVLETMGKFHALSFVLKRKNPKRFMELASQVTKLSPNRNKYWKQGCEFAYNFTINSIQREDHIGILKEMQMNFVKLHDEAFDKSEYRVICHGDCHLWNFVFKLEDGKHNLSKCKILDFQLMKHGPPAFDISTILGGHSKPEGSYRESINIHYESMRTTLRLFGLDIREVYPRSEYDKDLRTSVIFEATLATLIFVFSSLSEDFSPKRNMILDLFTGKLSDDDFLTGDKLEKKAVVIREKFAELFDRYTYC